MLDLPVQHRKEGAWVQTHLHRALDPSRPTFVLALPNGGPCPEDLAGVDGVVVQLAPVPNHAERFEAAFGGKGSAVLVRPDGYAGWIGPLYNSAGRVRTYRDWRFSQGHIDLSKRHVRCIA
ncbi:hypothetical protein [Methylobacterium pseudosasicola]|uniref:aromatic-ring hydroxylase C-terminal domain-containing protein n=1 Tax=Methylobacterium pseudosasicola TaxID=582667 RepID=UPI003138AFD0